MIYSVVSSSGLDISSDLTVFKLINISVIHVIFLNTQNTFLTWRTVTGIRTPWSFQRAVIPRLRAITPVRMEFGVHFDGASASGCEFVEEVATGGAFSEIGVCSRRS